MIAQPTLVVALHTTCTVNQHKSGGKTQNELRQPGGSLQLAGLPAHLHAG